MQYTIEQIKANQAALEAAVADVLAEHTGPVLVCDVRDALMAADFEGGAQSFQIYAAVQKVRPTPTLTTTAEAVQLMADLSARFDDVGVFWDRGWGDHGEEAGISIIVDGDGQAPVAWLTDDVYDDLRSTSVIGPNVLNTFKARRFHEYAPDGVSR